MTAAARTFDVSHVQLARAVFAAIAALMITFSPDHSAAVGLSVFSGFAIATGLIHLLAVWLVFPAGARWPSMIMGILSVVAGMVGGITTLRSVTLFFTVVIAWALATGLVETIAGARATRRARADGTPERATSTDALTIGIITLLLGLGTLAVPAPYALEYYIEDAGRSFTLTGVIIAVGIFGAYAAIVAVYLGIAGLSPRKPAVAAVSEATNEKESA